MRAKEHYINELILWDGLHTNNMPRMNGIDASKEIRKILPSVVIIMVTARTLDQDEKKEAMKSINIILGKPIEMDKMMKWLQEMLVKYSLHILNGKEKEPLTAGNTD